MNDGSTLRLTANLSANDIAHHAPATTGTPIWGGGTGDRLPPWSVIWRIGG
jgi:maltooligosyltrehalose trehalohydrolase